MWVSTPSAVSLDGMQTIFALAEVDFASRITTMPPVTVVVVLKFHTGCVGLSTRASLSPLAVHHHHLFAQNSYWQQLTICLRSRAGQKGTECCNNCPKRYILQCNTRTVYLRFTNLPTDRDIPLRQRLSASWVRSSVQSTQAKSARLCYWI